MKKQNYKVTDEQFNEAFRACEGNYAKTARYIHDKFNISYTRQSVQERAENHPEEFEKLLSIMDNESLTTVMNFASDITLDIKLRARLYVQVMNQINRYKRLKLLAAKLKAKRAVKEKPKAVGQSGDYTLRYPKRGDNRPTGQEAEKERREILNAINRNAPKENPQPDLPYQTADYEPTKRHMCRQGVN